MVIGIDYGSKMAGTTAICFLENNQFKIVQTKLKEDADAFIHAFIKTHEVSLVAMDAPLSLPFAFFEKGNDYFYRACDRALSAMSPMFLGGLTARAIKLKKEIETSNLKFIEVYPSIRGKVLSKEIYKKDKLNIEAYLSILKENMTHSFIEEPKNWHQIDAALALMIGLDYQNGKAESHGMPEEGLIWI
ncbi:MAG: hypothetical protein AAGK97_04665 [Bacteroidota bacterium]